MNQEIKVAIDRWCDKGMVFALCLLIFCLPASIALLDSFAALAIFLFLTKRISGIILDWGSKASSLRFSHKIFFIFKGFNPAFSVLNRPIEILALVVFISVLQSQFFALSLLAFIGKFVKGITLYFIFVEVITSKKRLRWFLFIFLMAAFLTVLSGVAQRYMGIDFLRGNAFVGERINSCFQQPNTLGAFLLLPLAIVCHLFYMAIGQKRSKVWLVILAVLLFLLMACLCWTYSRASWMGYLFLLFFMVLIDKRKILYGLILLMIFICIFLPSLNTVRHISLFKDTVSSSLKDSEEVPYANVVQNQPSKHEDNVVVTFLKSGGSGRFSFWKDAIFIIQKYPIWGGGINTYARELKHFALPYWYAHNCYLQMAAEIGLVGLGCFLWMLFVFFNNGLGMLKSMSDDLWFKALLQGILAGLFGFLVDSFFDNSLYTVQLEILFWVMMGFAIAVIHLNSQKGTFSKSQLSNE